MTTADPAHERTVFTNDDLAEAVEAAMRSTTLTDHLEALRPNQPDVVAVYARTVAQVLRRRYVITAHQ